MKTLPSILILLSLLLANPKLHAQDVLSAEDLAKNVVLYNEKINELIAVNEQKGFKITQEKKLPMRDNVDMVVILELVKDNLYHFCFVGDPSAHKIKATLFLEGLGDIIQDRIIVKKQQEFWTQFSFRCPETAHYELSLYQDTPIDRPLAYLTVFRHPLMGSKP
jgi:hypothetical protein